MNETDFKNILRLSGERSPLPPIGTMRYLVGNDSEDKFQNNKKDSK